MKYWALHFTVNDRITLHFKYLNGNGFKLNTVSKKKNSYNKKKYALRNMKYESLRHMYLSDQTYPK